MNHFLDFFNISDDVHFATKSVVDIVTVKVWPLMLKIKQQLVTQNCTLSEDNIAKLSDVFTLCCSQIKKCILQLLEIFKQEHCNNIILKESRICILERLSWCINRLENVDNCYNKVTKSKDVLSSVNDTSPGFNDSILATPMFFVNWIDHTFEVLTNLSKLVYRTDFKVSEQLYDIWKNELIDCVDELHISIEELLLAAMTLGKYCLSTDQYIVTARSQLVLREMKALMFELVEGDLDNGCKITQDSLKTPVMPTNVDVLIDVLKDVLYVLERNVNTALLALLVHCFSNSVCPIDKLKDHFTSGGRCKCQVEGDNVVDECSFVKDFDIYNERLLQIGSFAVSCSTNQKRTLLLRSGLASLEALDPHLVPALMLSPDSHHTAMLVKSWREEVQEIRDSVFLIVDPAAFAEKCKQMIHKHLLDILSSDAYSGGSVCAIINIGCVVRDFFLVYSKHEPDALTHTDLMLPLLKDLDKVQKECKIVSNIVRNNDQDFYYDVKVPENKNKATLEQLIKRLKLLYTLITKIHYLFHPMDNDEQTFAQDNCEEDYDNIVEGNFTQTIHKKNSNTYVKDTPKILNNSILRSAFARSGHTKIIRKDHMFSNQLKANRNHEINFSMQFDELFNMSEYDSSNTKNAIRDGRWNGGKEASILYNFSPMKTKSSLRKAVLNRNCKIPFEVEKSSRICEQTFNKSNVMNASTALQITEILDQFTDMSIALSTTKQSILDTTSTLVPKQKKIHVSGKEACNIVTLNVNYGESSLTKQVWHIPVNSDTMEVGLDCTSTSSLPSNVTTLERINDLDLLEDKLKELKLTHRETSL